MAAQVAAYVCGVKVGPFAVLGQAVDRSGLRGPDAGLPDYRGLAATGLAKPFDLEPALAGLAGLWA